MFRNEETAQVGIRSKWCGNVEENPTAFQAISGERLCYRGTTEWVCREIRLATSEKNIKYLNTDLSFDSICLCVKKGPLSHFCVIICT